MGNAPTLQNLLRMGIAAAMAISSRSIAVSTNPINRLARLFDSELVEVENRLLWLDGMLQTLAKPNIHSLKTNLGYRGGRISPSAPSPSIVINLGRELPITSIYLVPSQQEFAGDPGISPKRISLDCCSDPSFDSPKLIHRTIGNDELFDREAPNLYPADEVARYVRLTVEKGVLRQDLEIFGLSEIVVCTGDFPVSFGAKVITTDSMQSTGLWNKEALVDGRTPLGIWQSGIRGGSSRGDAITNKTGDFVVSWAAGLDTATSLDMLILYP